MLKNLLLILITTLYFGSLHANTITVDSTNNAGTGSLRLAINLAVNGDTIRFNPNLISNGSDSIVLDSSIIFSKDLTIIGVYTTTDTLFISGGHNGRIFFLDNTRYISLDSLVLINADTSAFTTMNVDSVEIANSFFNFNIGSGASVYNSTHLNVVNCHFKGNLHNGLLGYTGLSLPGGITHITNSSFISNQRTGLHIQADDSLTIEIDSSLFKNNSFYYGGGIHLRASRITAYINNSEISKNTATTGAGIYIWSPNYAPQRSTSQKLFINNTSINNNTAISSGGGIFSEHYANFNPVTRILKITNSTLSNNTVTDPLGTGGAIYSYLRGGDFGDTTTNTFDLINSTLTANQAHKGGGLYSETFVYTGDNHLNIKNTTIAGNVADSGGATYINSYHPIWNSPLFTIPLIVDVTSSILALNGANNINSNQNPDIVSGGYNIFSDSTVTGSSITDSLNVDSISLNLLPLNFYGGSTKTMTPGINSIALNSGNPLDQSDAQNGPISGIRDIGAI